MDCISLLSAVIVGAMFAALLAAIVKLFFFITK